MKKILSLIVSATLVASGYSQTRNVLVGTNNAVVQPTNFWSADASNARTGLGLGTAATSDVTAFQPSSVTLSNVASGNGATLTNLAASNISGTLSLGQGGTGATNVSEARTALGLGTSATNPASAFQPSSLALSNLAISNGGGLTNLSATSIVGQIPTNNLPVVNFTNISGTLSIAQGGTSATNAADARQNLGSTTVGDAVFVATNAAAARTAIEALSTNGSALGLTNFPTVPLASNVTGTIAISNGGSGATTAGGARTNLGLGATWLTNISASIFRSQIGLGTTNQVQFGSVSTETITSSFGNLFIQGFAIESAQFVVKTNATAGFSGIFFDTPELAAITRTNLGLGWGALTNTNSGTGLVSVNTNGEVVSPTNFWQVAPITTTFIESQPVTNFTTNIAPARFLHIHSLATNIANVTNTIVLPTNTLTFEGDVAIVVHKGPTNSMTRVQRAGSTNNLITLTRFDEAVQFVYYNDVWQFDHNIAFVEPIYFSGTNAGANAAASVTNLFTPNTPLVFNTNGQVIANTGTNVLTFVSATNNSYLPVKFRDWNTGQEMQIVLADESLAIGYNAVRGSIGVGGGMFQIKYGNNNNQWATPLLIAADANVLGGTFLTNTNVTNFRTAIGLGTANGVTFGGIIVGDTNARLATLVEDEGVSITLTRGTDQEFTLFNLGYTNDSIYLNVPVEFSTNSRATTRTNLGLGGGLTTNFVLKNSANQDFYMNFSNGILKYASTNAP